MDSNLTQLSEFLSSSTFDIIKIGVLGYLGLLWLSIIIWVTRDCIHRSKSLLFQTFSILLNIAIPFLGILLYLIIRPTKTSSEIYYEELEHQILATTEASEICSKCGNTLGSDFLFCPSCGQNAKIQCPDCKKPFSAMYSVCPYCGKPQKPLPAKAKTRKNSRAAKSPSPSLKDNKAEADTENPTNPSSS